jgi:alanine racemase
MAHLTWVEVDLTAIQNNVRRMRALTNTRAGTPFRVMAVVKANAYGHGAEAVARAAASAGADWFGVARASEGLALRAGRDAPSRISTLPILVLGYTPPDLATEAIGADLTLTVFDIEAAKTYAAAARALGRRARVHVKVDTGMGRLGVPPEDALEFVRAVHALEGVEVEGVFTHFAGADLADQTSARRQLARFETVLAALDGSGLRPPLVHAANSAAAIALPAARYDMVRTGIALYGLHPSDEVLCPPGFVPALSWKALVAQVKTLPPGHGISYGSEYVTTGTETVAMIPVGYADGFRRVPKNVNEVLIHGQRAKVRGRVCMDQIIAGVSHIPDVRAGDEVVLVGRQGDETMSAEKVARRWETINYDVTSGIMARVPRVYR